ncbi:MAG: DUF4139 domain-containing protein [bacterium]
MKLLFVSAIVAAAAVTCVADEIAVTVYNSNLGVISESRTLEFEKGVHEIAFRDVPTQIDAASVRFYVDGGQVAILEQNYAYDLVSSDQLYAKYVDQDIELIDKSGRLYSGTLLAYGSGNVTLLEPAGRVKIVLLENIAEVNFPSLPDGLITRPTLFWRYQAQSGGAKDCRVGYQTGGLNWKAEYVGVLDGKETELDLSGWSSITNNSGKTYTDATLKLVAGEISRAQPEPRFRADKFMTASAPEAAGFEEKAFFEYHLYTLPRRATVANKENKQISLFEPAHTGVDKVYTYRPDRDPKSVEVGLRLVNSTADGLGMPLPAGRVRLFKADDDGSMILLGEDNLDHTPRDEEIRLKVGNAFDIVGEETVVDQSRISQQVEERSFKTEIRNRKTEDITVKIEKKLYGYWQLMRSDFEYTKKDANTIEFNLPVAAGLTATVNYTVRFGG